MKLLNRRKFIKIFSKINISLLLFLIGYIFYKFLSYTSLKKYGIVKINKNKIYESVNEFPEHKVAVIREKNNIYVLSTVCTHLGCNVKWDYSLKVFRCPCHQSVFDIKGRVIRSPAKRPLNNLKFAEKDGDIIIWSKNF